MGMERWPLCWLKLREGPHLGPAGFQVGQDLTRSPRRKYGGQRKGISRFRFCIPECENDSYGLHR